MASLNELSYWLNEQRRMDRVWYVKRLSANDTLASGSHQAGPYMPKKLLMDLFPSLQYSGKKNPRVTFELRLDSCHDIRDVTAIWYNNKWHDGGTRDEVRITNWGGQHSALLEPENTGSLVIFSFQRQQGRDVSLCNVWVCDHVTEEDLIENLIGVIIPGKHIIRSWDRNCFEEKNKNNSCCLSPENIPEDWRNNFPTTIDILKKVIELIPDIGDTIDERLIRRRNCEFELFRNIEKNIEFSFIQQGFSTIDAFLETAKKILQRRKARSGRSLELHLREIFLEEKLKEGLNFSYQPETENGKRPDFVFPCENAYKNQHFLSKQLRMLAVKTTCKDRWRQILNEADRIPVKHLFTLQEGVSVNQFQEMCESNVRLVVPKPLINKYPLEIQGHLQTLESFVGDVRLLSN